VEALEEARRLEPGNAKVRDNLVIGYERLIEGGKARHPAQPDTKSTVAEESKAESAQASAEVRTAPDSGVRLVTVAPAVYELQAPGADAAGAQTKHGADSAAPAATVVVSERGSSAPAYALTTTLGTREVQVAGSPTTIDTSGNATEAAKPDHARQQELEAFKLEVSNGNGVGRMAARVAGYLARFGVSTGRLTNDKTFSQPTTLIEYREGYRTQAARIGSVFPKEVPVVHADTLRSDIHVRVVLGRDVRNDVALFGAEPSKLQLASEASERSVR
jgi:LytR cell envelope-related transcriptional attenuator